MQINTIILFGFILLFAGCFGMLPCSKTVDPVCGTDGVTYNNSCFASRAGVSIASSGACTQACNDSDGGKDIFTAGSVTANGDASNDVCKTVSVVKESFCENNEASLAELPCPPGYICENGACVLSPCNDSDGGNTPTTKGTAKSATDEQTDKCVDTDTVKEYFCENGVVSFQYVDCLSGEECAIGACQEAQCEDSDDGENADEQGTVTLGSVSGTDSCYDSDTVTEYYCDGNIIKNKTINCDSGYECVDGECVEEETCTDSDNGKDQFTKGTTSYENDEYVDNCYSSSAVLEYYCASDTEIDVEKINCDSGYECSNGKCVEAECQPETDEFDDNDLYFLIDDKGGSVRLYEGDILEINDEFILELTSISGNETTLTLFETYEGYQDNDDLCSEEVEEGNSTTDLCGEDTGEIEVDTVDSTNEYVELSVPDFMVIQYYDQEGEDVEWIGSGCPDDQSTFAKHTSLFFPYLDTSSGSLNLDGKDFKLLGETAEIVEIDVEDEKFSFEIDGNDYDGIEDGDTIEYNDMDYEVSLYFHAGGLYKMILELD
ncbi:hypothetical protein KKB44_04795 [Candidatus Micrarchaeota archaeon]|nr:hypothetical protein [Candidatus Micrarchaeota archaeon]